MPPTRTRLEREGPPPRRKSCHACVKAKRRCDQGQPACTRCSQRKIACHYPSRSASSEAGPFNPSPATPTAFGSAFLPDDSGVDELLLGLLAPSGNPEPNNHLWTSQKSPCLHQPGLPWAPAQSLDQSIEVANATSLGLAVDDRDIPGHGYLDTDLFYDFTNSPPVGKDVTVRPQLEVPAPPRRLELAGLHATLETNFSYAVDRVKSAPSSMLLANETPWCHPLLYRDHMPREMQGKDHQCRSLAPGHTDSK